MQTNGWDGVTKDEYWREILQKLGTETIKDELNYTSFHARRLSEDFQILDKQFNIDYFIVPDVRFRDEIHTMKAMFPEDVITIKVTRLDFQSNLTKSQLKHKSENDLNNFKYDYNIIAQNNLQHLYDETDRVLKSVFDY